MIFLIGQAIKMKSRERRLSQYRYQTDDDDFHDNWKRRQFGTTTMNNQNAKKNEEETGSDRYGRKMKKKQEVIDMEE